MTLYIRVRKDGFLYPYNETMAKNPACEVIHEREAYPERFVERPQPTENQKTRKPKVVLADPPSNDPPAFTAEDLGVEAGKGWPK